MRGKLITLVASLVAATAWLTHGLSSQDAEAGAGMDPLMVAMMEAGTPGEAHAHLAEAAGRFSVATKFWMEPGMPPMEAPATSSIEMIMDGRYMRESFKMDFMGMPFEGQFLLGFNNATGEYESVWIDNMSTGMATATGTMVSDDTMELRGLMRDVRTPEGRPYRSTTTFLEDGGTIMRMYDTGPDGVEFQNMEMTYTRN